MARDSGPTPAPGWCNRPSQKPPIERFVPQGLFLGTKRVRGAPLQTTPVSLCGTSPLISGGEPEKRPIEPRNWIPACASLGLNYKPLDRGEFSVKDLLCSTSFGTLAATFFGSS
jgi:hypothetical protein